MNGSTLVVRRGIAATILVMLLAGLTPTVVAHSPDPILSGPPGRSTRGHVPLANQRRPRGRDPKRRPRGPADDNNDTKNSRAATFTYHSSGSGLVGYGPGASCGVNGIACFTRMRPSGFTMWLREQGHVFDWGTLKWCQAYTNPPNGCYDAETIALDEFGHVQGSTTTSTAPTSATISTPWSRPSRGHDRRPVGTARLRPVRRRHAPAALRHADLGGEDLDLPGPHDGPDVERDTGSIAFGGTTHLTAALKVADAAAADRSAATRSRAGPTLQRRAPGTSTWTTVGVMPPTTAAGTYA